MKAVSVLFVVALVAVLASGCAGARAKTTPDGPPLDVPAPPPRDVESTAAESPQPSAPAPQEPARARPRPAQPREQLRPEPSRSEPPKPETPPAEPPKPVEETRPPSTLQTAPAGGGGEVERGIRATLTHATSDLSRVDYRTLNADARSQYDYAKRFIRQAEDALRAKNLVFAKTVAEKAASLAAQLAAR